MDNNKNEFLYNLKDCLLTETEKKYLTGVFKVLPEGYKLQSQVNLASIIERTDGSKFQNELYRNIDACIFDKNYKPIILIEINDSTHNAASRIERDKKVQMICEEAGIQIVKFWTKYGVNLDYMKKRIDEAIANSNNVVRIKHFNKEQLENVQKSAQQSTSACYIATSIYGSYDCPEVWTLRRFRDNSLAKTWYGRLFIKAYYVISPTLVKHFGDTKLFKSIFKPRLDKMVSKLQEKGYENTRYYH